MKFISLNIPGILLIEPKSLKDKRGILYESYREDLLEKKLGYKINFVQDNHCISKKGIVRGLHYQMSPMTQDKLVRVTRGEIFDVVVDLRKKSPTFGHYISQILSSENKRQLFIPSGFAHGFLTLSEEAEVCYKLSNYHSPESEHCLLWNDPELAISWPHDFKKIKTSTKDQQGYLLRYAKTFNWYNEVCTQDLFSLKSS